MFTIKVAGLPIGIDSDYRHTIWVCRDYVTDEPPLFTVHTTAEEREKEITFGGLSGNGVDDRCIHRQIAMRLPEYQAFVMHAAAIQANGKAYLFTAPSGTGKTTHAQLWKQVYGDAVEFVNGDKPIIRLLDGQFFACGSPWNGREKLGKDTMAPIGGLCFLTRDTQNSIAKTNAEAIIDKVAKQVFFPPEREQLDEFLLLLDRFLTQTPLYELHCNTEPEAAILAHETLLR